MKNITTLLNERFSCRDFTDQPLDQDILHAILDDAIQSPSWSNTQPYRIAIAQGEVRDAIAADLAAKYAELSAVFQAPKWRQMVNLITKKNLPKSDYKQALVYPKELQARRLDTAKGLYGLLEIDRHDTRKRDEQTGRNFNFFGAPTGLFIFTHKGLGAYSVLDAGILLQSIMLAAHARGVATCAQGALAMWRAPVAKQFAIPDNYQLLCGMSIGYASDHKVNGFSPGRLAKEDLLLPLQD